ncbi:MAG: hypothetical protein V2I76_04555 [Roseobacter sp.]|jgi:hypothetical protein|nr:hypothetical protein [Roseobacter sp.]
MPIEIFAIGSSGLALVAVVLMVISRTQTAPAPVRPERKTRG